MSASAALLALDDAIIGFVANKTTNVQLLSACFAYLQATDDWREVVEVMQDDLRLSKAKGVEWFNLMGYSQIVDQVEAEWDDILNAA